MRKINEVNFVKQTGKTSDGGRLYKAIVATEHLDRDREVLRIEEGAIDLQGFLNNPVVLFAHNYKTEPIGRVRSVEIVRLEDGRNALQMEFELHDLTPLAGKVATLVENGFLKAVSVAGAPRNVFWVGDSKDLEEFRKAYPDFASRIDAEYLFEKYGKFTAITDWELYEVSLVPVPANPHALVQIAKCLNGLCLPTTKGYSWFPLENIIIKQAIPYSVHGKVGCVLEGRWSKRVAVTHLRAWAKNPKTGEIDWEKYKKGFAWYNQDKPNRLTSYKFPHHDIKEGKLCVHRRGVYTAMAFLFKPNVIAKYPLEDRKGIYEHLAEHYRNDLNKEPPAFERSTKKGVDKYSYLYAFDLEEAIKAYKSTQIDEDEFLAFVEAYFTDEESGEIEAGKIAEILEKVDNQRAKEETRKTVEGNQNGKNQSVNEDDDLEAWLSEFLDEAEEG